MQRHTGIGLLLLSICILGPSSAVPQQRREAVELTADRVRELQLRWHNRQHTAPPSNDDPSNDELSSDEPVLHTTTRTAEVNAPVLTKEYLAERERQQNARTRRLSTPSFADMTDAFDFDPPHVHVSRAGNRSHRYLADAPTFEPPTTPWMLDETTVCDWQSYAVGGMPELAWYTNTLVYPDTRPMLVFQTHDTEEVHAGYCHDPLCERVTYQMVDPRPTVGADLHVALTRDGHPLAAYHNPGKGSLDIAFCLCPMCEPVSQYTASLTTTPQSSQGVLEYVSAAHRLNILNITLPTIAFTHSLDSSLHSITPVEPWEGLYLVMCGDHRCTQTVTKRLTLGLEVGRVRFSSIDNDVVHRPSVAFYREDLRQPVLAKCHDEPCTLNLLTRTSIIPLNQAHPSVDYGQHLKLKILPDDRPVFAYQAIQATAGCSELHITLCQHFACFGDSLQTRIMLRVDGEDVAKQGVSITVGSVTSYGSIVGSIGGVVDSSLPSGACTTPDMLIGSAVSLTMYGESQLIVSYRNATSGAVKLAVCEIHPNQTMHCITSVLDQGTAPAFVGGGTTSVAVAQTGRIAVSYRDQVTRTLRVAFCPLGTLPALHSWAMGLGSGVPTLICDENSATLRTADPTSEIGEHVSGVWTHVDLEAGYIPELRVSYQNAVTLDLQQARCVNAQCDAPVVGSRTAILDSANNVGNWPAILTMPDDNDNSTFTVHVDNTNRRLRVGEASDDSFKPCGKWDYRTLVDPGIADNNKVVGMYVKVLITERDPESGVGGLPMFVYFDETNREVDLAVCRNARCTSVDLIDLAGDRLRNPTVNIGSGLDALVAGGKEATGHPMVSYLNHETGGADVQYCLVHDCIFGQQLRLNPMNGSVARFTRMDVDAVTGLVRSLYYDSGTYSLRVASCTSEDCSTPSITSVLDGRGTYGDAVIGSVREERSLVLFNELAQGPEMMHQILRVAECTNVTCTITFLQVPRTVTALNDTTGLVESTPRFGGYHFLRFVPVNENGTQALKPADRSLRRSFFSYYDVSYKTTRLVKCDGYILKEAFKFWQEDKFVQESAQLPGSIQLSTRSIRLAPLPPED